MDTNPKQGGDSSVSSIKAVQQAWLDAMRNADVERLATLVTDDVVVVHGTGRCVRGPEELKADLLNAFAAFHIEQNASTAEIVVRGSWALEIADVETQLTPRSGGAVAVYRSTAVTALDATDGAKYQVDFWTRSKQLLSMNSRSSNAINGLRSTKLKTTVRPMVDGVDAVNQSLF